MNQNTEFLDVVNENDEVIDLKPRTEIHSLGLLHREIHVWMFDENKNIYFQKRGLTKPSAGLLDATVGGHVDKGEDYMDAAVRETREETGIPIAPSDLVFLKKVKAEVAPSDQLGSRVNNFMRSVYIYKHPIKENFLKNEKGIQGAGFRKFSYKFFEELTPSDAKMFIEFILKNELPEVLEYIK